MHQLKPTLFLLLTGLLFLATGCEETFEEEKIVIGKWDLESTKSGDDFYELEDTFTWEFREDDTYTITNEAGKFEDAPFDSTPFREAGVYEGQWNMSLSSLIEIREKYRDVMQLWVDEISPETIKVHFTPVDNSEDEDIFLTLVPAA